MAADEWETLLSEHEWRWTTHGDIRLYDVIHCAGDCDWRLRQKALMSDEDCYQAHRAHLAALIEARVQQRETAAGARALRDAAERMGGSTNPTDDLWRMALRVRADRIEEGGP